VHTYTVLPPGSFKYRLNIIKLGMRNGEREKEILCVCGFVNRFPIMLTCCCFVLTLLIEFD